MKELSIIIPFYNAQAYLRSCLNSILTSKTQYGFEVILIDDGSSDDSPSIAKEFESKYEFIKQYRQEHSGVSAARNLGIDLSLGRYICFIDADDMVHDNYIELLVGNMITSGADMVICGYEFSNGTYTNSRNPKEGKYTNLCEGLLSLEEIKRTLVQSVWNKIFRKDIIKKNNILFPENISIGEDHAFFLDYCNHAESMYTIGYSPYIHIKSTYSLSNKNYSYAVLKHRADMIYLKSLKLLKKYPSQNYSKYMFLNFRVDSFFSLIELCNEYNKYDISIVSKEITSFKSVFGKNIEEHIKRRHKLPFLFKLLIKTNLPYIIILYMLVLKRVYTIFGLRFNK